MSSAPSFALLRAWSALRNPAFPSLGPKPLSELLKAASRPAFPPLTHYISKASAVSSPHRIEKGSLADDTGESESGCLYLD